MINLHLAKNSGFCFGVKRAISLAEDAAEKYGKATTIGPIIHNPQMVQKLSEKGVNTIDDIDKIVDGPVIIRSHGIPVDSLRKLKEKKIQIIDSTCPYVAKAHKFAEIVNKEKYEIIILGNSAHPEIIALKSYIDSNVTVWENYNDFPQNKVTKVAVICQTTQNINNLKDLVNLLLPCTKELRIFNTICNATDVRQQSSLELAKKTELMIVIGGKNSSNTLMLAKLCSEHTLTKHIEEAGEIERIWFDEKQNIGLTAGASTPDWIIIDIYNKIKGIVGDTESIVNTVEEITNYVEEPHEYECSK